MELQSMKKYDNYIKSLHILKNADYTLVFNDEIYRMGVIGQFHLTFELAWKALQEILRIHGVSGADQGSPREILKLGYASNFLSDPDVWLLMLKKRNESAHIYDEDAVDELVILIRDSFIPAFERLAQTLRKKIPDTEESL